MSRTKEQKAWDNIKRKFNQREVAFWRVENIAAGDGMSDVIAINRRAQVFWIENKALEDWPVRPGTFPLRTAFEPGQLPFMRQWRGMGGLSFVLLRVALGYWLLSPEYDLPNMTAGDLTEQAVAIGRDNVIAYLESVKV